MVVLKYQICRPVPKIGIDLHLACLTSLCVYGSYVTTVSVEEQEGRKEGNVLFNDTLNTFYLHFIWRHT